MNSLKTNKSLSSNKILYIILLVIIILLYALYNSIRNYNNYLNTSPYIIDTIRQGNTPLKVAAHKIPDPHNNQYGQEYTYCFWIYINDTNYNNPSSILNNHILHKGSNDFYHDEKYTEYHYPLLQAPGIFLKSAENTMIFNMNILPNDPTSNATMETIEVSNIPINKWVHIALRLISDSVEVYINSNLKIRYKLLGTPRLNDGDLYVTSYSGFNGYLSKLIYFNYAIDSIELDRIYSQSYSTAQIQDIKKESVNLADDYWLMNSNPVSILPPPST